MASVTIHSDFVAQENKVCHCFPSICHEVMGPDAMILVFWMLSFKPTFSPSSFTFIKRLFSSYFAFCYEGVVICIVLLISALISFRIDWLDFLAVQRALKSLTQHPQIETVGSSGSQSPSAVILEHKKIKSALVSTFSPSICHEVMGPDATILVCWMLKKKSFLSQFCHYPLSSSSRGSLVPLCFLPSEWYHLHIWGCWCFSGQSWLHLVRHPAWHFAWCTLHIS